MQSRFSIHQAYKAVEVKAKGVKCEVSCIVNWVVHAWHQVLETLES